VEQRKAYDTYQIKGDYTEGSGGLPDYSTTEQKTGRKWIDGKDIYFATIVLDNAITINANSWSNAIDLTGDKLIAISALYSVEKNVYPVGGNTSENKLLILNIRGSVILVDTIIAYYTKTT
jgi:hypothetical protein